MEAAPVKTEKARKEKKSEKKAGHREKAVHRERGHKEKKVVEVELLDEPSLAERLGMLAPMLMAAGGAVAYTRFPVVQDFVNSAVGQLMQSLTVPECGERPRGGRGCVPASLSPAS